MPLDCTMISLDVVSLFTFIAIQFSSDVIRSIYPDNSDHLVPNIDSVIKLGFFCRSHKCFKFNDVF